MVFQDPYGSLNPRLTVAPDARRGAARPQAPRRRRRSGRIAELLDLVHLPADALDRYPHEFSRRPAAADRHRPGALGRAGMPDRRRAGLGARRLGPGAGDQPSARAAGAAGADRAVRRPRSAAGAPHLAPGGGDVSRRGSSSSAGPSSCSARRATPIPRRCSAPRRSSIRPGARRPRRCAASCRARSRSRAGCPFHPRCPYAFEACRSVRPELEQRSEGGRVACHLASTPARPAA